MSPVLSIVLLWLGFAGTHMWLSSHGLRPLLVARFGDMGFQVLYSIVSFLFFVPLVWVYLGHRHEGAWLWTVTMTPALTWALYALMTVGVILMVAGIVSPSPMSMTAGGATPDVRGVHRITRHPLFMGLGWIGLWHLVANASATDVAFFAGLPLFAIVGCRHQELRMKADRGPEFGAYLEATSFLPFSSAAAFRGLTEIPLWVYAVGVGASAGMRWLH